MRKNKVSLFFKKYINGTKGAISLFLAIMMVPFVTIAGALINAGRLNSAVAVFDEALCNASNSALGTYDEFLRSRFGLMAVSQNPEEARKLGIPVVQYSSEDFIQELFIYYMEQNLGSLSNTYDEATLSADGIYPLTDPNVLKASVLQASKITVPAKLVVEWGALEDMLSMLTEPFDMIASFEEAAAGGMDVVGDVDKLNDKQDELEAQIQTCNTARTNYENAYTTFKNKVNAFNTLVGNINSWQGTVNSRQQRVDQLNEQVSGINSNIESKEQQLQELEESEGDHSEQIQSLQEEIGELEEKRDEVAPEYDQAVSDLESAKRTLQNYKDQFSGKRTAVINARTTYQEKISALRTEINKTKNLAIEFQDAGKDLVNDTAAFIADTTTAGLKAAQESNDKKKNQIDEENVEYQKKRDEALAAGDEESAKKYDALILENNNRKNELNEEKRKYKNADEAVSGSIDTMKDVSSGLTDFANRDLAGEYKKIYDKLGECYENVGKVSVPESYSRINYSESACYYKVKNPVEKGDVSEIISNIESQIVNNSGWVVLKTLFGFFDALFEIGLTYDPNLTVNIDTSHYSANGGLPSSNSRKQNLVSNKYAEEDAEKSLEYKKELNTYASEDVYEIVGEGETEAEKIEGYINEIKSIINDFSFRKINPLWTAVKKLIASLVKLGANIIAKGATSLLQGMRDKLYLVGYVSYYTANRTTYTGNALTGTGYNLPQNGTDDGYVFAGAEMEYIFKGTLSEIDNQKAAFTMVWVERMVFNISGVLSDPLVQSLAAAVGSFTFGIGDVVVKLVFLILEALVDTALLANGGTIPILKNYIYLSPTGLPKLLENILTLQLSEDRMRKLYDKSVAVAEDVNEDTKKFAQKHADYTSDDEVSYASYDEYKAQQKDLEKQNKITDKFRMDYTKSLQIWMLLFGNSKKYWDRLADIIEMEAMYNANKSTELEPYTFNLDKSYTYIRTSGNFSSGVFIKIGEDDSYTSKFRVIYNGY